MDDSKMTYSLIEEALYRLPDGTVVQAHRDLAYPFPLWQFIELVHGQPLYVLLDTGELLKYVEYCDGSPTVLALCDLRLDDFQHITSE